MPFSSRDQLLYPVFFLQVVRRKVGLQGGVLALIRESGRHGEGFGTGTVAQGDTVAGQAPVGDAVGAVKLMLLRQLFQGGTEHKISPFLFLRPA